MMPNILVVDDDASIRSVIRMAVEDAGMHVTEAANGKIAVMEQRTKARDLIVLDIGMPELDGFDTCKNIRAFSAVPILFLTARDDEIDRVLGFQLGGDDYVTKPFSPRELVLRIKAILGRARRTDPDELLDVADLTLRRAAHEATLGDNAMDLTAVEFALLYALAVAPDRVHSRDQLITAIYGPNNQMSDRTIDSHMRNLRQKAKELGCADLIRTVHGVGLRLGGCKI